mgnify:CR=1 FL=1
MSAPSASNAGVRTQHREYRQNIEKWRKIRKVLNADCKDLLRNVGENEPDKKYGEQRQREYADGAIFYNFTKRTLSGMVGAVMRKPPEVILPDAAKYLLKNTDGAGIGLIQHAQNTLKEIDSMGRGLLLVDAPTTEAATMAEKNAGLLNSRVIFYAAESIINWHKEKKGSTDVVTQVVLSEPYEYQNSANEFEWLTGEVVRVLEIVDNKYRQRVFKFDNAGAQVETAELIEPRFNKSPIDYIPAVFVGADSNTESVDASPLDTLVDVNIGHYQNSADYEDAVHVLGQGSLFMYPGERMTTSQLMEANPNGIRLGCRTAYNLGYGGRAELVQLSERPALLTAMETKENQAVMIGAQLITPTQQITAESARLQRGADTSIMATIAQNVSEAYEQCIRWVCLFAGVKFPEDIEDESKEKEICFELNTEFFLQQMTAQDRSAWIADINAGLLPARAYYAAARSAGVTNWSDDEIEQELERQPPAAAPAMDTNVTGEIPSTPTDSQQNNEAQQ